MPSTISPTATVVRTPADLCAAGLGSMATGARSTAPVTSRVPPVPRAAAAASAGITIAFQRVLMVLGGLGEMLVVAGTFPLAILVVGIPIVLLVRLVLWFAGGLRI